MRHLRATSELESDGLAALTRLRIFPRLPVTFTRLVVACILIAFPASAFCQSTTGFGLVANIEAGVSLGTPTCHVDDLPQVVRDVPIHPDDGISTPFAGPIANTSLRCSIAAFVLRGRIGLAYRAHSYGIVAGGSPRFTGRPNGVASRNYLDPSGPNTAETFYGISRGTFENGLFVRVYKQRRPAEDEYTRLFIDYEVTFADLNVATGWIRYEAEEERAAVTIATTVRHRLTAGRQGHVKIPYYSSMGGSLYAGVEIQSVAPTAVGRSSRFNVPLSVFVGASVSLGKQ